MNGTALERSERFAEVPQSDLDAIERTHWPSSHFDAWHDAKRENEREMAQIRAQMDESREREEKDILAWEIYEREMAKRRQR